MVGYLGFCGFRREVQFTRPFLHVELNEDELRRLNAMGKVTQKPVMVPHSRCHAQALCTETQTPHCAIGRKCWILRQECQLLEVLKHIFHENEPSAYFQKEVYALVLRPFETCVIAT